jgi:HK97 family phage major capsid protein
MRLSEKTEAQAKRRPDETFLLTAFLLCKHHGDAERTLYDLEANYMHMPNADRIADYCKSAIGAGTTSTSGWASQLLGFDAIVGPWARKVSALTFLGRMNPVAAPFRTRLALETSGVSADYVAQGTAVPVSAISLDATTQLEYLKIACIVVYTDELFQLWSTGSAAQIDESLTRAVVRGSDAALLDPDSAAVSDERPASLLNGVSPLGLVTNSATAALSAFQDLIQPHIDAGSDLERVAIGMHPSTALQLSVMQFSGGSYAFPNLGPTGGTILNGIPAHTSVGCVRSGSPTEKFICAIDGAKVIVADGGMDILAAKATALEMSDRPSGDSTSGTGANLTSLYQTNAVALRLRRWLDFRRADTSAVSWMTSAF